MGRPPLTSRIPRRRWLSLVKGVGVATGVPLAERIRPSGRRWSPWDIADSCVVDTAGIGPLTVEHGDSDGLGFHASAGGFGRDGGRAELKPSADRIRRVRPFGSPKPEGQHDRTRRNTGGHARSQVDPLQGGTGALVHRHRRWRDHSPLCLAGCMDGPPSLASVRPPTALREGHLNGFPRALAEVRHHCGGGGRRRVPDAAPKGVLDARFVVQPAYSLGPHSVSPLRRLAGGCAPSDPPNGNGAP